MQFRIESSLVVIGTLIKVEVPVGYKKGRSTRSGLFRQQV